MKTSYVTSLLAGFAALITATAHGQFSSSFGGPTSHADFSSDPIGLSDGSTMTIQGTFLFDADNQWLRVVIENTSQSGHLMGFGFNSPYADNQNVSLAHRSPFFKLAQDHPEYDAETNSLNGHAVGSDIVAYTGLNPVNRGRQPGIAPGGIAEFDFYFGNVLEQGDDFSEIAFFGGNGGPILDMNYRLLGETGEERMQVFGNATSFSGNPITPVPEPSVYALGGILVLGAAVVLRQRRRSRAS